MNGNMYSVNTCDNSLVLPTDVKAGNIDLAEEENAPQPETSQSTLLPDKYMEVVVAAQLECLKFKKLLHSCGEENMQADFPAQSGSFSLAQVQKESSSSDSETDSDSSSSLPTSDDDQQAKKEGKKYHAVVQDELLLEELPLVEDLTIILPKNVGVTAIGIISNIIEQLVIIESLKDIPPLKEGSILFKEDGLAIGKIFEIFGPVSRPFYMLRFKTSERIEHKGINLHDTVYFAPSIEDFTKYIFIEQLKKQKGSDASWMNDQEPPAEALDFSDDEQEKHAKQTKKPQNQEKKKNKFVPWESRNAGGDQQSSTQLRNNSSKPPNPHFPNKKFFHPPKKAIQDPVVPVKPLRRARPPLLPSPLYPPRAALPPNSQGFPQTQKNITPVMPYYSASPSDYKPSYYEMQNYLPPNINMGWPAHNVHPPYLQGNSYPLLQHQSPSSFSFLPPPPPPPPPPPTG
uniref:H/ACA ribonucleoprotein complex non-core subunit NAF1 n=1 Tax=Geotrypetes seraphini TaxID=260995 RepID=A0A6P8RC96_GEOSA|nr:H/ACA ribonucleoprotein complex non-core subunit NAF1 [Geotrypetes seraphini]XP_033797490.1 H/ACA ribonucleoprotein complex non-core subunit NAF1 [Geotrypetes seraphini]XP_033797501.1 H/ACA ribonucleoprotein complex non-core subunit NAF1 [Geotrypetes seraphini]